MEKWDLYDEFGRRTGQTWERRYAKEIPEERYPEVLARAKNLPDKEAA